MYELEDNIPIAPSSRHAPDQTKYRFGEMTVGQSFFVPCPNPEQVKKQSSILSACAAFRRKNPGLGDMAIATRTGQTDQEGREGIRVWRIG